MLVVFVLKIHQVVKLKRVEALDHQVVKVKLVEVLDL